MASLVNTQVGGRPALVAYITDDFKPTSADKATMAKVNFTDGGQPSMMFLKYAGPEPKEPLIKYNPDQPRDPKGSPTGGQWTVGAGTSDAKPKVTDRIQGLSPEDAIIQDRAIQHYEEHHKELMLEYYKKFGNKVANADEARKLFTPDALGGVGYTGKNAAAVHEAASALNKDVWRNNLKNPEPEAWLYAGGPGSGKSTAIEKTFPDLNTRAAAILDGTMSKLGSSAQRIKEAVDAGKNVKIAYVYREPLDAWENGVIARMLNNPKEGGRVVRMTDFVEITPGALKTAQALKRDGFAVVPINNSLGRNKQRVMSDSEFMSLSVPEGPMLRSVLVASTQRMLSTGKITQEQFHALTQ